MKGLTHYKSDDDEYAHGVGISVDGTLAYRVRWIQSTNGDDGPKECIAVCLGYIWQVLGEVLWHQVCPDRTTWKDHQTRRPNEK